MIPEQLRANAADLIAACAAYGLRIATAESCTGGLIAATLSEIPGASRVLERGFVTYTNEAKVEMIGVDPLLIERVGAVSPEVVISMAEGAVAHSRADMAVAVTGLAGPDGGTPAKPIGLVYLAVAVRGEPTSHRECRFGSIGRSEIRAAAVLASLAMLRGVAGRPAGSA